MKLQGEILDQAAPLVAKGGRLVYSTCSILPRENEQIVEWALQKSRRKGTFEIEPIEREGFDEIPTLPAPLEGSLCIRPTDRYEGFFVARIKRTK